MLGVCVQAIRRLGDWFHSAGNDTGHRLSYVFPCFRMCMLCVYAALACRELPVSQIQSLEESAELLRERCLKFHKGCRNYAEGLGEAYDGDIAFASSLETFGGGHNDPISVAFGGPVMTKFTIALREIGTYKEVLRSQVECLLNDRLLNFVDIDLHDVNDAHKRFDKASLSYDQVREATRQQLERELSLEDLNSIHDLLACNLLYK
ncbi:ADP-ribosylation factor GTPase-activating protein AGD3 [Zea mays]|uniref:ADP-ribosylation factor GTPase-activating protein AGD3 n=1 Tax=Zea mays TaxID=4577 RepID=A0A317YBG1_MAIZE|nr:ADP-ribosylation factor GTPase-activating protein AGD3 [Zea mays]